ncbi:MAG: S8 family serine peptidase [Anaerolineales bacterium]|nr:S8 family serine peptidase [Anaerolineales bacterium]
MNTKTTLLIMIISFMLLLPLASHIGFTQEAATPTPSGLSIIQGGGNLGKIQPYSVSEIVNRTGIRAWQQAGWTGTGQKVGVLDRGFGGLYGFEQAYSTMVTTELSQAKDVYNASQITHGTHVLEIIYLIAPAAQFYACQYNDYDQFVTCVNWMIANDVNIINHSAGVPALPLDGTNEWAREVERAERADVLWINAAGNFARGYLNDFFNDNPPYNTFHEFRGSGGLENLCISAIDQSNAIISLSWANLNDIPANAIDLDLEIADLAGNVIYASQQQQLGNPGDRALEYVTVSMNQELCVRVRDVSANAQGVPFVLFVEFAMLPASMEGGSVIAPGDSVYALTVGALQSNRIAPYSSRGVQTGALIKPDITAPGEIILPDGSLFVGTSASAPLVSGFAALVWEANPDWTRQQIWEAIRSTMTQDDSEYPGPDFVYGMGQLVARPPQTTPTSVPTQTPLPTATIPTATPTQTPTPIPGVPIAVVGHTEVAVYAQASAAGGTIGIAQDQRLPIVAISPAKDFYLVFFNEELGWISVGDIASVDGDVNTVPMSDYTAPPSPTPTPTNTPTPTATATNTPTPTITPVPTSEIAPGGRVLEHHDFDSRRLVYPWVLWNKAPELNGGQMIIQDQFSWADGIVYPRLYRERGILMLFKYEASNNQNQMYLRLERSGWLDPDFRSIGLSDYDGHWAIIVENGKEGAVNQEFNLRRNEWYYLLIQIGAAGDFYFKIWEQNNPQRVLLEKIVQPTGTLWNSNDWFWVMKAYTGTLTLEWFERLTFSDRPGDAIPFGGGPVANQPNTVVIPGTFQHLFGCADWAPECAHTALTWDESRQVWQGSFRLPAGTYEYKVALNGSWDWNYGACAVGGGSNVSLKVNTATDVTFMFDPSTSLLVDSINDPQILSDDWPVYIVCDE